MQQKKRQRKQRELLESQLSEEEQPGRPETSYVDLEISDVDRGEQCAKEETITRDGEIKSGATKDLGRRSARALSEDKEGKQQEEK